MKTPKADLSLQAPSASAKATADKRSDKNEVDPIELLNSLKEKYRLFSELKTEGLINHNRHLTMERELKQAITDLEILIPKLEVT